jgi:hypothetical protein
MPKEKLDLMDPKHPEHKAYIAWLRSLTMKERGDLIVAKCREAAAAERARIAAGLPPTPPDPIPESTLEFFRRCIAQQRMQSAASDVDPASQR